MSGAGAFLGGVGGIVAGGFMVAAAATTATAIVTGVLAIPALLAVGVVTGPALMLAPVTVVASALSVGFGGVVGFFKGCGRFINHVLSPKTHGAEKTADAFAAAEGIERDRPAVPFKSKREVFMAEAKKLSAKERQELLQDICSTLDGATSPKIAAAGGMTARA